jgi:hypothetical protein
MSELSWAAIKRQVYTRARGYCEYCQTTDENTGQAMHTEHIDPDGGDILDNLCLSCANCNLSKASAKNGIDPVTNLSTPLFNPRTQRWNDHFEWLDSGLRVLGLTATGRATVERLKMNRDRTIRARRRWIENKNHPPE